MSSVINRKIIYQITDLSNIYRKLGTGKPWAWHCRPILAFNDLMYAEIFVSVEKLGDFIPIGTE